MTLMCLRVRSFGLPFKNEVDVRLRFILKIRTKNHKGIDYRSYVSELMHLLRLFLALIGGCFISFLLAWYLDRNICIVSSSNLVFPDGMEICLICEITHVMVKYQVHLFYL